MSSRARGAAGPKAKHFYRAPNACSPSSHLDLHKGCGIRSRCHPPIAPREWWDSPPIRTKGRREGRSSCSNALPSSERLGMEDSEQGSSCSAHHPMWDPFRCRAQVDSMGQTAQRLALAARCGWNVGVAVQRAAPEPGRALCPVDCLPPQDCHLRDSSIRSRLRVIRDGRTGRPHSPPCTSSERRSDKISFDWRLLERTLFHTARTTPMLPWAFGTFCQLSQHGARSVAVSLSLQTDLPYGLCFL